MVGVDADLSHIAMAAEFVAAHELAGVELVAADARSTGLASDAFDVVHARALLINVPDPVDVVMEMVRLTRPGGWVAAMEPDTDYAFSYPTHPAFERLCELFPVVFSRNGANPKMGRRVPELFWAAGLTQVGVEARVQLYPHGHSRRTIRLDLMRAMRSHAVAMGLATETELDKLDRAARSHLDDPTTVVVSGHLFLTWGLKPPSR